MASAKIKFGLSLFAIFHLFAVIVAPNNQTYLGNTTQRWIEPYLNFFELVSGWNFFAPEPGPPPLHIEWELLDRSGSTLKRGQWPEMPDPFFIRERQNRRIAAARFMVASPDRAEKMLVPYLCSNHPDSGSVRIWQVYGSIPPLFEVGHGKRKIGDNVGSDRKFLSHTFCEGPK